MHVYCIDMIHIEVINLFLINAVFEKYLNQPGNSLFRYEVVLGQVASDIPVEAPQSAKPNFLNNTQYS